MTIVRATYQRGTILKNYGFDTRANTNGFLNIDAIELKLSEYTKAFLFSDGVSSTGTVIRAKSTFRTFVPLPTYFTSNTAYP